MNKKSIKWYSFLRKRFGNLNLLFVQKCVLNKRKIKKGLLVSATPWIFYIFHLNTFPSSVCCIWHVNLMPKVMPIIKSCKSVWCILEFSYILKGVLMYAQLEFRITFFSWVNSHICVIIFYPYTINNCCQIQICPLLYLDKVW